MMKGEDAAAENNEQQAQDDAAAETAAAEVAKTDEEQSATKPEQDKEVPIDDKQNSQTKEAEQTGETTITDANEKSA